MSRNKKDGINSGTPDFLTELIGSKLNLWYWDLATDHMTWTLGTFELFETAPRDENMLSFFKSQLRPSEAQQLILSRDLVLIQDSSTFEFNLSILTAKDNVRWVQVRGEIIKKGKEATGLFGICNDVTHLTQTQVELKTIQRESRIGFWHLLPDGSVHWSRAIREMSGLAPDADAPKLEEWMEKYIHEGDRKATKKAFENNRNEGVTAERLFRQIGSDGQELTIRSVLMPSPFQKEKVIGSFQDVTREMSSQRDFIEQSKSFDEILQTMIVGVAKVNMEGTITFANEAALNFLEDRNMVGRHHISESIGQIDPLGNEIEIENMPFSRTLRDGSAVKSFKHGLLINGKLKWFSVNSAPLFSDGKQIGAIANFIEITEEIEAQKLLVESEERYRLIAENTGDLIALLNPDGTYSYISPNITEIRGYTQEEIMTLAPLELIHPDDLDLIRKSHQEVLKGHANTQRYRHLHKNDDYKWYEGSVRPLYDENNKIRYILNTIRLIHDQKLAEDKLLATEARYRKLIEESPFAIQIYDLDGTMQSANREWENIWGVSRDKAIGWYNLYKDKNIDALGFRDQTLKAINGERGEFQITYNPGALPDKSRHLSNRYFPLLNNEGEIENIVVFNDDVTKKVLAERKLQESEEKFKALAENLPGVIYMSKVDPYELLYINESIGKITGYSKEELLSEKVSILSLIHADDQSKITWTRSEIQAKIKSYTTEYRIKTKDQRWIWVRDSGAGIYDEEGALKYVEGYFEDITESRKAFNEVKLNEQRFRTLFENSGHGIGIMNKEGLCLEANRKLCEILGYSEGEFRGRIHVSDFTEAEDMKSTSSLHRQLFQGKINSYQIERRYRRKDGQLIFVNVSSAVYYDPETNDPRIIATIDDITSSKLAEEAIRNNEKKFRSLFENAGHGIVIADSVGVMREVNAQALKMFGYSKLEMEGGLSLHDVTHPEDLPATNIHIESMRLRKNKATHIEKRYIQKNGKIVWASVSTSAFNDPVTGEIMLVGIIDDITDKKNIIQEIQSRELKFRSVFEETGHGIAILDQNKKLSITNKKFRQILGLTQAVLKSGITPKDFTHIDSKAETDRVIKLLQADTTKSVQTELRYFHKNGNAIWVRLNASSYYDPLSNETQIAWIIEDVTKRREALDQLKASEEFQHDTIDALSIGLMVMRIDGRIEQTNKIWDRIIDSSPAMYQARESGNFLQLIRGITLGSRIAVGLSAVINNHSPMFELEIVLERNKWYALRASKLNPKFNSLVITLQEVTVRKRVEQALEESLSKYRNIYNMTPVMMHSIDQNGLILSVSNFWLEKLGYQRHEVIGRNLRDFLTEESRINADIVLPVFFERGSIFDVSYHFLTKEGELVETMLSAIEEGKGTKNSRSLAVVTDITPLKRAERLLKRNREELLEAQSIARIGNYEMDIDQGTFSSSAVFDNILEISNPEQKKLDLFSHLALDEDLPKLTALFKGLIKDGLSLDYVGRVVTLKSKQTIWLQCLGRIIEQDGQPVKVIGTIQDITKSKTAEIEIQKLSDRLKLAMEGANIGVWEADLGTGKIHWEATMYDLFQLEPPVKFDSWDRVMKNVHPDDNHVLDQMKMDLDAGMELVDFDYRLQLSDGIHHFRSITRQVKNNEGNVERMVGVVIDISRDRELVKKLETSLNEKDILIKEVHHRVKNNMQMISSILALKSLDLRDEDSKKVFDDCTIRIKSMAVVHDQLYRFYNVSEIDMSDYLHHLSSGLNALMGGRSGDFVIDIEADEFKMDVDIALLCGLIVSELVANAFKHGFKGFAEGLVSVKFRVEGTRKILVVTNTGNAIPPDVLEMKTSSLGVSLIKTFATQLGGKVSVHESNGLQIEF